MKHLLKWRTFSPCRLIEARWKSTSRPVTSELGRPFFITTPIFYVNADPHIGHLYTALQADALARWQKLKGKHVLFSTGTDEHGQKIEQAAALTTHKPREFCDLGSAKFKHLFERTKIEPSDFVRTTEVRHIQAAQHLWSTLADKGYIYKGNYEGWYSTPDECFLSQKEVEENTLPDGRKVMVSKESGHEVHWITEENYMFRLSEFSDRLNAWFDTGAIHPTVYEPPIRKLVKDGLSDLSISRHRSRCAWGIPVPGDHGHVMYVWLDALTNYLTVGGYPEGNHVWPADCHIVGKDILKFHALFWPAFLMAAGLEPPRRILCHGHWLKDREKMSKSKGNVVDPLACIDDLYCDAFRYFLLREGTAGSDNTYNHTRTRHCITQELSNTLGNLLRRSISEKMNKGHCIPEFRKDKFESIATDVDRQMLQNLHNLQNQADVHFANFEINKAIECIMQQLRDTNGFYDRHKPWINRNEEENTNKNNTLYVTLETIRICAILLQPIIPEAAHQLLTKLNVPLDQRWWDNAKFDYSRSELPLVKSDGLLVYKKFPPQEA